MGVCVVKVDRKEKMLWRVLKRLQAEDELWANLGVRVGVGDGGGSESRWLWPTGGGEGEAYSCAFLG